MTGLPSLVRGKQTGGFPMNLQEIFKRFKIGSSLVVGFVVGKLAATWNPSDYSALFSAGFLAGAVGTQGVFRLLYLWRQKRLPQ